MSEWHGWSRSPGYTGEKLHIGPLPGRKSICLYSIDYTDGAVMRIHAFFRSEDEARTALAVLDRLLAPADVANRCPRCEGYEATYHTFEGECSEAPADEAKR